MHDAMMVLSSPMHACLRTSDSRCWHTSGVILFWRSIPKGEDEKEELIDIRAQRRYLTDRRRISRAQIQPIIAGWWSALHKLGYSTGINKCKNVRSCFYMPRHGSIAWHHLRLFGYWIWLMYAWFHSLIAFLSPSALFGCLLHIYITIYDMHKLGFKI